MIDIFVVYNKKFLKFYNISKFILNYKSKNIKN